MKAVILAAGYATRLYPLTLDKPKCLLPIGDTTILSVICEKIVRSGQFDGIIIVTNSKFLEQLEKWKKNFSCAIPVQILDDGTTSNDNRLGAIGDFEFAIKKCGIKDDVLLLASDNLFEQGFTKFLEFSKKNAEITIALFDIKKKEFAAKKYGVVEIDPTGKVTRIEEKPEEPKSSLIGMGVYYFPKKSLPDVSEYMQQKDKKDAPGYYVTWLLQRTQIYGFCFSGLWYDIGDLQSLNEADRAYQTNFKKDLE